MITVSHPLGNQNVRAALHGFLNAGILGRFYTSLAVFPGTLSYALGGIQPFSEIRRRVYIPELKPYTKTYPWKETGRLLASKVGFSNLIKHEKGYFSVDAIFRDLDKKMSFRICKDEPSAVYAYEDGAAFTFASAKQRDIKNLYDLPIGYWRTAHRLLKTELEKSPEWASTFTGFLDSKAKLVYKDEELQLADHIFVASSFASKSLEDYPASHAPVSVIPYGFPPVKKKKSYNYSGQRILKALYVGSLSQRKGIAYLFEALEQIGKYVELTVIGQTVIKDCAVLNKYLKKHKWIPTLSNEKILQLMYDHDVLLFPSLFEGFGLVMTEAMSQGTPVITTDRTAGPDIIKHNCNGWIIEAGSTESLTVALTNILQKPILVKENGQAALHTAKGRPWSVYGEELAFAVTGLINALNH